ncbi:MAG: Asp-tRNA(Asn)/Glu-tRNA(Gln) amidotransferase subunit GatC [Candidatus Komeilibacteria bacterium]|nr:Asp-tRNA(Asn)/Glu-tRNA(Gln) amidotransferase subunit GatC [Candidatus Komeilibacteria bacterium]
MLTVLEVEKLAKLAKIELTAQEKRRLALEMSSILEYVKKLQAVKTEDKVNKEIKASRLREDRVIGLRINDQKELINQAPESVDNLIKTKPVF